MKLNIASNVFLTIITLLTPIIVIPLLTNNLGLDVYGIYVKNLSLVYLVAIVFDLGLGMYIPKQISMATTLAEKEKISICFIYIKLSVIPISSLLMLIFLGGDVNIYVILILLYQSLMLLDMSPVLNGYEDYKRLALSTVVSRLFMIMSMFSLNFEHIPLEKVMLIQVITITINLGFNLFFIKKKFTANDKCHITIFDIIDVIKSSFEFYVSRIFINVYQQSSVYISSLFLDNSQVAIYSISLQLYKVGQALIGAVSRVLYTSTAKTKDFVAISKATKVSVLLLLLGLPIVISQKEIIFGFIFEFDMSEVFESINILYSSLFFVVISSYWGYPALTSVGKERYAHVGIFVSSLMFFIFIVMFAIFSMVTMVSISLCFLLSDAVGAGFRLYYARKFCKV